MDYQYQKPIYDPWEVFTPPVAVVEQAIKLMKKQAYDLLNRQNSLRSQSLFFDDIPWCQEEIRLHKRLCFRIKDYEARLRQYKQSGSYVIKAPTGRITDGDLHRAREAPIRDYYQGKLRRYQLKDWGKCPFHVERHSSFVIYVDQNSWWCYGCSSGGDVIDFIMKLENLTFVQAVKLLINKG